MAKEKSKDSASKNLTYLKRFRWGILLSVTILAAIILFPSLVVTKHQYELGDVAERDIKSPKDFFIEDQAATETNRQLAVDKVLTVYDYDAGLAESLTRKVDAAPIKTPRFNSNRHPTQLPHRLPPMIKTRPPSPSRINSNILKKNWAFV